jgi:transglutaminase-like putative cysteine protease
MKKNKVLLGIVPLLFLMLSFSGCVEYFNVDNGITYEAHPIKIRYTIRYGYDVICQGHGDYEIFYDCDLPVNSERITFTVNPLHKMDYEEQKKVNNTFLHWNIQDSGYAQYRLGLQVNVTAEGYVVMDVEGTHSLAVENIPVKYQALYEKYSKSQSVNDTVYIDPSDPSIVAIAQNIKDETGNSNSYLIAKNLFLWMMKNTRYQLHTDGDGSVQPAKETCEIGTGDCDDLSFFYISLCRACGIPARFIRGYLIDVDEGGIVSAVAHAWVEVFIGGGMGNLGWIPVECACPSTDPDVQFYQNFGVESAHHLRVFKMMAVMNH